MNKNLSKLLNLFWEYFDVTWINNLQNQISNESILQFKNWMKEIINNIEKHFYNFEECFEYVTNIIVDDNFLDDEIASEISLIIFSTTEKLIKKFEFFFSKYNKEIAYLLEKAANNSKSDNQPSKINWLKKSSGFISVLIVGFFILFYWLIS